MGAFLESDWGRSIQKQLYLPEAYTDFILAIIAEELGFFGVNYTLFFYIKVKLYNF